MAVETRERRILDNCSFEVRTNDDGTVGVSGYAAVYDSPAHGEVIRSTAFTRSLEQRDNIRFLVNHEGTPLASTRAGTMTVTSDAHGLKFDIPSLDLSSPRAMELVSAVRRGDLYQCSFAMTATDDPVVDGLREVREAKLWELSGVTFPWYEDTDIGMTGDRAVDRALVALRSAPLTTETRDGALRALRAAPPGRQSYNDVAGDISEAIYQRLEDNGATDPWFWLDDFGPGWCVYAIYDGGGCRYFQVDWSQAEDRTITLGDPFEVDRVTQYLEHTDDAERSSAATPATRTTAPVDEPATETDLDAEPRTYSVAEARALIAGL